MIKYNVQTTIMGLPSHHNIRYYACNNRITSVFVDLKGTFYLQQPSQTQELL